MGVVTALAAAGALASGYGAIKQAETAERGQREQKKMIENEQAIQKAEIDEQQATEQDTRKTMIDRKRRALLGAKSQTGVVAPSTTQITGEVLG